MSAVADWHQSKEWKAARKLAKQHLDPHCILCGKDLEGSDYTIDHIVPPKDTGGIPNHDLTNLQAMCRSCNGRKQDRKLVRVPWLNQKWLG